MIIYLFKETREKHHTDASLKESLLIILFKDKDANQNHQCILGISLKKFDKNNHDKNASLKE